MTLAALDRPGLPYNYHAGSRASDTCAMGTGREAPRCPGHPCREVLGGLPYARAPGGGPRRRNAGHYGSIPWWGGCPGPRDEGSYAVRQIKLTIHHLYADMMNLYGDRGNVIAIKKRCEWRSIPVEVVDVGLT